MGIAIFIILILGSCLISGLIVYGCLRPKLKASAELDEKIQQENEKLRKDREELYNANSNLKNQNYNLTQENNTLVIRKEEILNNITNLNNSISTIEKQAQEAADLFYNEKMKTAQDALARALEQETEVFEANVEHFKVEYEDVVKALMEEFEGLSNNITILRATNDAAIAAAKRAEEMKDSQNYYRIQLSAADVKEIELLRSIEPHLRDKEPLNKVIWKVYYEKPTADMIGRVVGSGIHTGIYKITDIESGKCYVGQAANIADRWKQHIKRGVGAEAPTRNKLYPAMNSIGPENFTFEIIEECSRAALDEREDYWQDYFKAKEFGYSIK